MSSISTISIKRPVLAIVMNLVIVLFGGIGFTYLGIREFPSVDPPVVTVRTGYPGANSEVIESQITEPLEKAINGIEGVKSITSASNQGSSSITVEFNLGVNMETAANDVRDKVSQAVRELPQDIEGLPVVSKADANADVILAYNLRSNTRNIMELSDYAENVIAQRLQTVTGVSGVQIWGQKRYAMRIWLDPAKLSAYRLTALDVRNALNRENIELPTGKISGNSTELTVKAIGRLTDEASFNDLIIATQADRTIRLRDIGRAIIEPENPETGLRINGEPMVGIAIIPQPGSNYIEIVDECEARITQIKKELPADLKLAPTLDKSQFIRLSIKEVEETLLIALILVVLIIYLFFRNWAIAFRPLIDIPVSLIGTFFIMYLLGFSINVLTLLAVVLATGLVVDDGIVVTENIYKKIEQGMSPIQAAIKGSNEIFFAVISTSITLAAVFLPVIFIQGLVGALFREFGITLASAVLISAFVSLTLTPMLNARLVRKSSKPNRFYTATEPFFEWLNNSYRDSLTAFMGMRWLALVLILACMGVVIGLGSMLKSELAPLEDRSLFRLSVTTPEGANYEYTDQFVQKLGKMIADTVPESDLVLTVTSPGFAGSGASNTAFVRIRLVEAVQRERSQMEIADQVGMITRGYSEGRAIVIQEPTISSSGGGGARGGLPVQYILQAPSFEKLREFLPKFTEEVRKDPTFQISDVNLKFNKPELEITIDRSKSRTLGVSIIDVAQTLQLAMSGQRFGYFIMNSKQYQIIGQVDRENRDETLDLKSLFVRNAQGQLIQLDNLVQIKETSSPPQLYRYNRYNSATVSAALAPGKTIADGIAAMDRIKKEVLDESFSTALSGSSRDFAESSSNLYFAFILALVLVYLVLAAQFESFSDPFVIMLTVPLAIAGAVFSLWFFNQTLNIFSQIGIIMLVGLVTKNGILIVEFANQLRERGFSKREAIISGSVSRLRPILMTSFATALGALPIAMSLGAASKSRMGMGIVVVGGVMFSLLLTLYVIPAMYSYLSRHIHSVEEIEEEVETLKPIVTTES